MDAICDLQERALAERLAGRFEAAERSLRGALRLLAAGGEARHPDAANLGCELADLLGALRRDTEAEACAREALEIVEEALATCAADDAHGRGHLLDLERIRIEALARLASALRGQGRYAEARGHALRGLRHAVRCFGPRAPEAAERWNDLGVLYKYWGRLERAARAYARASTILAAAPDVDACSLGTVLYNLGGLEHARGAFAQAEPLVREALDRLVPALGAGHPDVGAGHSTLAAILLGLGRWDEAERAYRAALTIFEAAYGERHPDVALVLAGLAQVERGRGALHPAEALARRALDLRRSLLGAGHAQVAYGARAVATLWFELGRGREARALLSRELAASRVRNGAEHPATQLLDASLSELDARAHP